MAVHRRSAVDDGLGDIMKTHVIKVSDHKWAAIVEYEPQDGGRYGYWCEDIAGGWGTHDWSLHGTVLACAIPRTYRTKREALEAAG